MITTIFAVLGEKSQFFGLRKNAFSLCKLRKSVRRNVKTF